MKLQGATVDEAWPIYSLANYEGGGRLIAHCRSILFSFPAMASEVSNLIFGQAAAGPTATTSSQANLASCSRRSTTKMSSSKHVERANEPTARANSSHAVTNDVPKDLAKADVSEPAHNFRRNQSQMKAGARVSRNSCKEPEVGLHWWQLVDGEAAFDESGSARERLRSNYRDKLLELSLILIESIRDSLVTGVDRPARGGVANKVAQFQSETLISSSKRVSALGSARQNAAQDRRLIWRRRVLGKHATPAPAEERDKSLPASQGSLKEASRRRRSASFGATFSLNNRNRRTVGTESLLDEWFREPAKESDCHRGLMSNLFKNSSSSSSEHANSMTRWSKLAIKRGKFGESLVHILIVNQSNESLILLVLLLHFFPALVGDLFESRKFANLTTLHLSIAYGNERLLKHLIRISRRHESHASLIECKVTGTLFRYPLSVNDAIERVERPEVEHSRIHNLAGWCSSFSRSTIAPTSSELSSQSSGAGEIQRQVYWCDRVANWPTAANFKHLFLYDQILARASRGKLEHQGGRERATSNRAQANQSVKDNPSSSSPIYLGQSPLAWSVSFRSRSMYELLIGSGRASKNSTDAMGNTCLHLLVINDQQNWLRFLIKSGTDSSFSNSDGLTAFLLACRLGRYELFNEFLELSAVEFWSYSAIRCCGYPLVDLDSIFISDEEPEKTGGDETTRAESKSDSFWKNSTHRKSAMAVILESDEADNEQKSRLLSSAVVKRLLEEKWRIFARRLFYRELLLSLMHLFLLTVSISLRPVISSTEGRANSQANGTVNGHSLASPINVSDGKWNPQSGEGSQMNLIVGVGVGVDGAAEPRRPSSVADLAIFFSHLWQDRPRMVRHSGELATALISFFQLLAFSNEWLQYRNLYSQWVYNPLLPNLVVANLLVVSCLLLRLTSVFVSNPVALHQLEDIALILAAPLLWSSLLFFIAAFRVTGPFVAMIRHMIVRDLRQFSVIYLVFLHAFAQCIFFVNYESNSSKEAQNAKGMAKQGEQQVNYRTHHDEDDDDEMSFLFRLLDSYAGLWMDLFKMTLGVYDLQPYRHSGLARLFFLLFIYLIPILFNMLIAMMNNTYSLIISQSEKAWSFQWARTLFALERRLGEREKGAHLRRYAINMVVSTDRKSEASDADADADEHSVGGGSSYVSDHKSSPSVKSDQSWKRPKFKPGLMIIKRMNYTRAERRRLILGYWQKSIRATLNHVRGRERAAMLKVETGHNQPGNLDNRYLM